jgi:tetratricopeptide (TPR) repeat protein
MQRLRAATVAAALLLTAGCALREPVLAQRATTGAIPPQVELAAVPFFPQDEYQCGPAALATVLAYSGRAATPESLAPRMYLPDRRGSLQVELVAAARSEQRIPYVLPPALDALLDELRAGRPVVVLQNLGIESVPIWHFAVVVGYSAQDETFVLRSGTERRKLERSSEFGRSWTLAKQWAMVALRPGELPAGNDAARYLKSVADVEAVHGAAGLSPAYRAALDKWPDSRVARFGLASALDAEGQLAGAANEYRALLAQNPDDPAPLNNLADLQRRSGCRSSALATIDRALAAAATSHPLRPTLERTRSEIAAMPAGDRRSCAD